MDAYRTFIFLSRVLASGKENCTRRISDRIAEMTVQQNALWVAHFNLQKVRLRPYCIVIFYRSTGSHAYEAWSPAVLWLFDALYAWASYVWRCHSHSHLKSTEIVSTGHVLLELQRLTECRFIFDNSKAENHALHTITWCVVRKATH